MVPTVFGSIFHSRAGCEGPGGRFPVIREGLSSFLSDLVATWVTLSRLSCDGELNLSRLVETWFPQSLSFGGSMGELNLSRPVPCW
jgi:hypothetical protein